MTVPENWERVYIVNYAVNSALREEKFKVGFSSGSDPRLRRLRSAAWAPLLGPRCANRRPLRVAAVETIEGGDRDVGHDMYENNRSRDEDDERVAFSMDERLSPGTPLQLLAVANDCGGFYVMKVSSPFTDGPKVWEVRIVKMCFLPTHDYMIGNIPQGVPIDDLVSHGLVEHQSVEEQNDTRTLRGRPSLLAAAVSKKNFIEDISWSPWNRHVNKGNESSLLTIKRNGVLSMTALQISTEQQNIQCHCSDIKTRKRDLLQPAQRFSLWFHNVNLPALYKAWANRCRLPMIVTSWPT